MKINVFYCCILLLQFFKVFCLKESFITHTFKPFDDDEVDLVCINISPDVVETVNNLIYKNLDNDEFNLVFEIEFVDEEIHVLSILNYMCYVLDYYTDEIVLQIEDEIFKVLVDFLRHSENGTVNLHINMLSTLKVTVL